MTEYSEYEYMARSLGLQNFSISDLRRAWFIKALWGWEHPNEDPANHVVKANIDDASSLAKALLGDSTAAAMQVRIGITAQTAPANAAAVGIPGLLNLTALSDLANSQNATVNTLNSLIAKLKATGILT